MELSDFVSQVSNFVGMNHPDKVKHLAWYLHFHRSKERVTTTDIRQCYEVLHLEAPTNISDTLAKLALKTPKVLLKSGSGYRLQMQVRQDLDAKYSDRPITIEIHKSLAALPPRLADETNQKYLSEAIRCLKVQCFRAAILMVWNLTYDHLILWVMGDPVRLAKFNGRLPNKEPFISGKTMVVRSDFELLREREVVDICGHKLVGLITDNQRGIIVEGLERRNRVAHPSTIEVIQVNAEDTISSLVQNIVLKLT